MMKKINLLVLRAFIGPFLVVFSVLVLIFLIRFVLMYIEEISGKGLAASTYFELFFYFSFNSIPMILPLAVLFSTLLAYGNLGQHNELTAIKSAGVSLVRILVPIFIFTIIVSGISFYLNNTVIPKVNLKAYQLLWDIKHKKAAFNIKEGVFYNEIPSYSIKVDKIYPDGKSMKGVIIYDHQDRSKGNVTHIVADSGYMKLVNDETMLELELFNGKRNSEHAEKGEVTTDDYVRSDFSYSKLMFDLTSFKLDETPEELFAGNRQMMCVDTLDAHVVRFDKDYEYQKDLFQEQVEMFLKFGLITDSSIKPVKDPKLYEVAASSYEQSKINAYNRVKNLKYQSEQKVDHLDGITYNIATFQVEKLHKYVQAAACIIMFLIGAPIGSILKKGGMGFPGLITVFFFIVYYVIYITFEKYARAGQIDVYIGSWGAILTLLPFGLFFVYQASIDSNLFEFDLESKLNKIFKKNKVNTLGK
jgi:lipopolysaccharide export system permease protein